MLRIRWKAFLLLAVSGLGTHSFAGSDVRLKIATLSPEGSFWMTTMRKASKEISKKTEDRVRFRFYPGGVMGNDKAVLKKIKIGQLQGAALSGGAFSTLVPDSQVYNLPRIFKSYAEVDYVRAKMDKTIEKAFEDKGWVNFGLAEGGFAYLMSKQPVTDISALSKHKVWIPTGDPASEAASDILNVSPTPLSLGDVLAGLQTEMIDSVFASPIAAIALQWHTQVSYITDVPLVYFYALLAIDEKAFAKISKDDQAVVRDVMKRAFKTIDKQNRLDNEAAFAALKKQGIELLTPSSKELNQWNNKTAETTAKLVKQGVVNSAVYTDITTLLKQYEKQATQAPSLTASP